MLKIAYLLLISFCLFLFMSFQKDIRKISVSTENYKIEAFTTSKQIKPKNNLTYYWYKSRKIYNTEGNFSGELLDDKYESFFFSGALHQKGHFNKGLKNGLWFTYDEKGNLIESKKWRNGKEIESKSIKKTEEELFNINQDSVVYHKIVKDSIK